MRRAEGSSAAKCAELREQTKGPGQEEQLWGETEEGEQARALKSLRSLAASG